MNISQTAPGVSSASASITSTTVKNSNGKRPLDSSAEAGLSANSTAPKVTASGLPALQRTDKNGEPLSEKKLRRLEKNRLSARECRRRKREATENLQRQINMLEGENLRLRLQLQVGEEAEESSQQEQQKLTEGLDTLLKSGASEAEVYAKIEEYKEKFADYGRDRRSAIEFHLRNIERLLMPTQTTSVIMATLNMGAASQHQSQQPNVQSQNDTNGVKIAPKSTLDPMDPASSAPPPDAKSLFKHLVQILDVSPEQASALKDSRFVAQEMDECLKTSLAVLTELRGRLTQCGEDLENEFNTVRSILTPTQAAKFLVWVANNKACMHMLNELWHRVYPTPPDQLGLNQASSQDETSLLPTRSWDDEAQLKQQQQQPEPQAPIPTVTGSSSSTSAIPTPQL